MYGFSLSVHHKKFHFQSQDYPMSARVSNSALAVSLIAGSKYQVAAKARNLVIIARVAAFREDVRHPEEGDETTSLFRLSDSFAAAKWMGY